MTVGPHIADKLQRELTPQEREHLLACTACREENELLQSAREVIAPLPAAEPRVGFAAMVALNARDRRAPGFAHWLRWALGGAALAGAAALALVVAMPGGSLRSREVMIAQRLDLFEDMTVLQNREALEDLDVVSVLHQLQPEAQP